MLRTTASSPSSSSKSREEIHPLELHWYVSTSLFSSVEEKRLEDLSNRFNRSLLQMHQAMEEGYSGHKALSSRLYSWVGE